MKQSVNTTKNPLCWLQRHVLVSEVLCACPTDASVCSQPQGPAGSWGSAHQGWGKSQGLSWLPTLNSKSVQDGVFRERVYWRGASQ